MFNTLLVKLHTFQYLSYSGNMWHHKDCVSKSHKLENKLSLHSRFIEQFSKIAEQIEFYNRKNLL